MKLNDAVKMLEENRANSVFNIYIPSKQQEFPFRFITVSEQMTISKLSMEEKQFVYYSSLMALMMSTYAGENFSKDIDINTLTEIDKAVILAELKRNSTSQPFKYNLKCPKCRHSFTHSINMESFIEACKKIELKEYAAEIEFTNIKYNFNLSWPVMNRMLDLYKWAEESNEGDEFEKIVRGIYGKFAQYIKSVYLNDEELEDWQDYSMDDKMKLFESFPESLLDQNDENSLINIIDVNYEQQLNSIYTVNCANSQCGYQYTRFIDPESFFLNI